MTDPDRRPIVDRLSDYYSDDQVWRWLAAPHPQLGGRRAKDLIEARDFEPVHQIIDRLDADAFL